MVNGNQIPKTETVCELKNEVPSFEEFMQTYEYDSNLNYADLNGGDIGTPKGYDPCSGSNCPYSTSFYTKIEIKTTGGGTQTYFRAAYPRYATYYGNNNQGSNAGTKKHAEVILENAIEEHDRGESVYVDEIVKAYGPGSYAGGDVAPGRKEILFEKGGKKYKILAEVEIRKWFLRNKVKYAKMSSLSDDLSYCSPGKAELVHPLRKDNIFFLVGSILLVAIAIYFY
nr:8138_t:CDS:2 [Entrophospora candida]